MLGPVSGFGPWQTPDFDEYTVVLRGLLRVGQDGGVVDVSAGRAVLAAAGERVRYSTGAEGAEHLAVWLPAFSPDDVNREDEREDEA
ncbi:MAG: cupin domain-containing protein [Myxococcota bacterium]